MQEKGENFTINWDGYSYFKVKLLATSNLFCDLIFNLNLVQMVNESTHIHGNILDFIANLAILLSSDAG